MLKYYHFKEKFFYMKTFFTKQHFVQRENDYFTLAEFSTKFTLTRDFIFLILEPCFAIKRGFFFCFFFKYMTIPKCL